MFDHLINDNETQLSNDAYDIRGAFNAVTSYLETSQTIDLFNYSPASNNGQMSFQSTVVPEPISIVLFGTGGLIVVVLRRRNE